jgi:Na+-transporting NADH:ubiquinone oxidoreductase subunit A
MKRIILKKGLDLPLAGQPESEGIPARPVTRVALLGRDYIGMKPALEVRAGDRVKKGQVLFRDKKQPRIRFTAPGAGRVISVNRGEKRVFLSIVIGLEGEEEIRFSHYTDSQIGRLSREKVKTQLLESGLWTSLRARPFGRVANPDQTPHSIFITAMDTNPLAPPIDQLIQGKEAFFRTGLVVLSRLVDNAMFLCQAPGASFSLPDLPSLTVAEFQGPHPAGNPGTHIHFLDPVHRNKSVWHIGLQDVTAIGTLFSTGTLPVDRVVSLAGPEIKQPRLIETRLGASVEELVFEECHPGFCRPISGPVWSGHTADGPEAYLGRYHQQIVVLPEVRIKRFLGWLRPGFDLFSVKNVVASRFFRAKRYEITTEMHGGKRTIVPVGSYEKVVPLDILPTFLLRALAAGDLDEAENLGCLELVEEDLALCTFACPSKIEHGHHLRRVLDKIEKEG